MGKKKAPPLLVLPPADPVVDEIRASEERHRQIEVERRKLPGTGAPEGGYSQGIIKGGSHPTNVATDFRSARRGRSW